MINFVKNINGYEIKDETARIIDYLDLNRYVEIIDKYEDIYNGNYHNYLQGFCKVGNNIIMCLYDATHSDNYVKLVEFNPENKEVIRSKYLTLYHANSITYDETNGKLYLAPASKVEDDSVVQYNHIIVIDYNSLDIIDDFTLTNLPENTNIRSVFYDNNENILYCGDKYKMFSINTTTKSIINSYNLEVVTNDGTNTNQTLKKYGSYYVGLYYGFIAFWNNDLEIVKILNIHQIQSGEKLGEPEDFYIEDDNLVIGFTKKLTNNRNERYITFYKTNINTDTTNNFIPNIVKNDTTPTIVYVDSTSEYDIENGTETFPFKDLQNALNVARNTNEYLNIHIKGGSYNLCEAYGCDKVQLYIENDATIDGLSLNYTNMNIVCASTKKLTLNGLQLLRSKLIFRGDTTNKSIINYFNNSNVGSANNKSIYSVFSTLHLGYCVINAKTDNDACQIIQNSIASFDLCDFNDYTNGYAININQQSNVTINRCTFNVPISDSQGRFNISNHSILNTQFNQTDDRMYNITYQGKVYGNTVNVHGLTNKFYGDVCDINTEYKMMKIKVKMGGYSDKYKYFDVPTDFSKVTLDSVYVNDTAQNTNLMTIENVNGKLSITEHRRLYLNATQYNYETITETPSNQTIYSCISAVEFYNI